MIWHITSGFIVRVYFLIVSEPPVLLTMCECKIMKNAPTPYYMIFGYLYHYFLLRFSSPAYFSRYVQRNLGLNPTEYRG